MRTGRTRPSLVTDSRPCGPPTTAKLPSGRPCRESTYRSPARLSRSSSTTSPPPDWTTGQAVLGEIRPTARGDQHGKPSKTHQDRKPARLTSTHEFDAARQ